MLVYISRNALSPRHKTGADESDDRYGKKDPQGPRNALYDLDADIIGVDQLDKGDVVSLNQNQHIQRRSGKSKDQGVRHGPHRIPADMHTRTE